MFKNKHIGILMYFNFNEEIPLKLIDTKKINPHQFYKRHPFKMKYLKIYRTKKSSPKH